MPEPNDNRPPHEDELAPADDAVIGKAVRWSIAALVVLTLAGLAVALLLHRKPPPPMQRVTKISAPSNVPAASVELPTVKFTDMTREAGLTFVHHNGAYGAKLLPETMGGGVAFLDYDNDGHPDLLFINCTAWPDQAAAEKKPSTMALFHNDGTGHFQDATSGSGLDVSFYGMGVAVGDYDNDGLVDVLITGVGGNHLFHNEANGKFKDVTVTAGVGGAATDWSTSATWLDYDNDGKLDLFVCNYVKWSKEIDFEVGYKLVGVGRAYGQPNNFQGAFSCLYHNDGGGKFTDVSARAGIQVKNASTGVPTGKALGVVAVDVNNDGWMDLVVANDTVQNFVFINQKDGTFKELGSLTGVAFDTYGNTRGAMGIDAAHYRNDPSLGIAIGNFANEMTALYVAQKDPMIFTDEAIAEGIGPASRLLLKFGVFFFDYDLDGRLDVLTADGHLEEEISKIQKSQQYAQPAQLFWNTGGKGQASFASVSTEKAGADLFKPIVGRGCAYADIDGDGDLDVILTQINGPPLLLRNDQKLGHHWVRLKLVGRSANHDALGASVILHAGDLSLPRQVMASKGYMSCSELPLTFGLGALEKVDSVEINWGNGKTQRLELVPVDKLTVVQQP